jgi:sRNA-binding carbon storage regulator CsrA
MSGYQCFVPPNTKGLVMLVMLIKDGEWVQIGEAVVRIERRGTERLRLAVDAPRHIPVVRESARVQHPRAA